MDILQEAIKKAKFLLVTKRIKMTDPTYKGTDTVELNVFNTLFYKMHKGANYDTDNEKQNIRQCNQGVKG